MSKQTKKTLVPKLRFPEFKDAAEWEIKPFDKLFTVGNGRDYKHLSIGSVPVYGSGGYMHSVNEYLYDGESVCIGRKGTINNPMFLTGKFWTVDTLFYTHSFKNCLPRFIYSIFQNINWLEHNEAGGVPSLSKKNISKIEVAIPKLKEQQKIADCLSSVDELITTQAKKVEALKAHKKGLMQQLFPAEGETVPKLRFPEFRVAGEWDEIKLIDTADKKIKWSFIGGPFGSNLKSSDYVEEGIRIIQLQNIGDAEFKNDYQIFTSEEKANELLSNNIYPGDIILSKMGDPVGRACLIPDAHDRYVMCSDGIRLVVDEKLHSKYFIYSLINADQFRSLVEKTATGSTRKRIGLDDLKNLPMVVPKKKEQQKIADCLSSVDELITTQAKKVEALKAHKKGLMQQLFPSPDEVNG